MTVRDEIRSGPRRAIGEVLCLLTAFVVVDLGLGLFGPLSESVRRTAGGGFLVLLGTLGVAMLRWRAIQGGLIGAFGLAFLLFRAPPGVLAWATPLVLLLAASISNGPRGGIRIALAASFACLSSSLWLHLGAARPFFLGCAEGLGSLARMAGLSSAELGATQVGIPSLLGLAVGLALADLRSDRVRWALWAARLIGAPLIASLVTLGVYSSLPDGSTIRNHPSLLTGGHHVLGAILVILCLRRWSRAGPASGRLRPGGRRQGALRGSIVAGVVVSALLWLPVSVEVSSGAGRRVLFVDDGLVDWKLPDFTEVGPYSIGMFGGLAASPELFGFQSEIIDPEDLAEKLEESPDSVLVLINCSRQWDSVERDRIWEHVENGGGLLVIGDHTDVGRQRRSLNPLLERVGISIRFDSAFPLRPAFDSCLSTHASTFLTDVDPRHELFIDVGASLDLSPPARPEITGLFAFSDAGVLGNLSGAHLGNYYWDDGERLGDLTLAASAELGKGRVLVFGDTSGFQNAAMRGNLPRVLPRVFKWLGGGEVSTRADPLFWVPIALLGLVGSWGAWTDRVPVLIGLGVLLAIGSAVGAGSAGSGTRADWTIDDRVALLDLSAAPTAIGCQDEARGLGTLANHLLRLGFVVCERRSREDVLGQPGLIVIVEPSAEYGPADTESICRAVEQGATCAIFVSAEAAPRCRGLLDAAGLRVRRLALGTVPHRYGVNLKRNEPRFAEAFPLILAPGERHEVLYRYGEYVIAAACSYGKGRFVVVADGAFPQSWNLHDERSGPNFGNVLFLKNILPVARTNRPSTDLGDRR